MYSFLKVFWNVFKLSQSILIHDLLDSDFFLILLVFFFIDFLKEIFMRISKWGFKII